MESGSRYATEQSTSFVLGIENWYPARFKEARILVHSLLQVGRSLVINSLGKSAASFFNGYPRERISRAKGRDSTFLQMPWIRLKSCEVIFSFSKWAYPKKMSKAVSGSGNSILTWGTANFWFRVVISKSESLIVKISLGISSVSRLSKIISFLPIVRSCDRSRLIWLFSSRSSQPSRIRPFVSATCKKLDTAPVNPDSMPNQNTPPGYSPLYFQAYSTAIAVLPIPPWPTAAAWQTAAWYPLENASLILAVQTSLFLRKVFCGYGTRNKGVSGWSKFSFNESKVLSKTPIISSFAFVVCVLIPFSALSTSPWVEGSGWWAFK